MLDNPPIEPIGPVLLVRPLVLKSETARPNSVIVLPDEPDYRGAAAQFGDVLAIGEDVSQESRQPIRVGDRVMFTRYAGYSFVHNGEDFRLLKDFDILGRLTSIPQEELQNDD